MIASPHAEGRIYFAANKVFRSNDYGNSWAVLGDDLSAQINRNELKVYDRVLSIDAVMKNGSTSQYGTIVAMSESTIDEDLLAVGTDDGLIQISEDGGQNWRKVASIEGAPAQSYVNNIYLSNHNVNVIYAALNHHKYGDFRPYLYMSMDKGMTWKSISNNLPERGSVYAIEEDFEDKDLLFCGTEFGVFFSPNGGERWKKLGAGLPTIAVRDIAIQKREQDLVLGTFGRGFYVLDDYSSLRSVENKKMVDAAEIYDVRDALLWEPAMPLGLPGKAFQGDNYYTADNLGPVAMFTYFFNDEIKSLEDQRREVEKSLAKDGKDVTYPSYDELKSESEERGAELVFVVRDEKGEVVRRLTSKPSRGLGRIEWDLRYPTRDAVDLSKPAFYNPFGGESKGAYVSPGEYSVELHLNQDGALKQLHEAVKFNVLPLKNTVMPASDRAEKLAFQEEVNMLSAEMEAADKMVSEMQNKLKYMKAAVKLSNAPLADLQSALISLEDDLRAVSIAMYGDRYKRRLDINEPITPSGRIGKISWEQGSSTADPTSSHRASLAIAKEEFAPIQAKVKGLYTGDVVEIEKKLKAAGAPYTPGRVLQEGW